MSSLCPAGLLSLDLVSVLARGKVCLGFELISPDAGPRTSNRDIRGFEARQAGASVDERLAFAPSAVLGRLAGAKGGPSRPPYENRMVIGATEEGGSLPLSHLGQPLQRFRCQRWRPRCHGYVELRPELGLDDAGYPLGFISPVGTHDQVPGIVLRDLCEPASPRVVFSRRTSEAERSLPRMQPRRVNPGHALSVVLAIAGGHPCCWRHEPESRFQPGSDTVSGSGCGDLQAAAPSDRLGRGHTGQEFIRRGIERGYEAQES